MRTLVFAMLAAGLMAGALPQAALADIVAPAQAKLAAPLSEPQKVVIDGRSWRCVSDTCKAGEQGTDQPAKRECGKLAKAVGAIAAYTYGGRDLSAELLADCNESAKK